MAPNLADTFPARLAAEQRKYARRFYRAFSEYSRALAKLRAGGDYQHRGAMARLARECRNRAEDAAQGVLACYESADNPAARWWTLDAVRAQLDERGSIREAADIGAAEHSRYLDEQIRATEARLRSIGALPY